MYSSSQKFPFWPNGTDRMYPFCSIPFTSLPPMHDQSQRSLPRCSVYGKGLSAALYYKLLAVCFSGIATSCVNIKAKHLQMHRIYHEHGVACAHIVYEIRNRTEDGNGNFFLTSAVTTCINYILATLQLDCLTIVIDNCFCAKLFSSSRLPSSVA